MTIPAVNTSFFHGIGTRAGRTACCICGRGARTGIGAFPSNESPHRAHAYAAIVFGTPHFAQRIESPG
ncbi:MAG: hypothetical protein IT175_07500 [Acidobacteria bacterium]|nr:hypothetical protein [Acidobacteriota bacterium]